MKTAYLRTFVEVVNLNSFSKAAEKFYLSQPAVTKQIKSLEKEFGVILLRRFHNDIIPTAEGKEFYQYATTIINKEDEIYNRFSQRSRSQQDVSGVLTIFSSSLPATYLLPDLLYDFMPCYKNIAIDMKKTDSKSVFQYIESGRINFGFTGRCKCNENMQCIELVKDQLVLAVSAKQFSHLDQGEVDRGFLFKQNLLLRGEGSATLETFYEALEEQGHSRKDLKIKGIIEDNETLKKMIINGLGVSVVSRLSIEKEIKDGLILPLNIKGLDMTRSIYFVYHSQRYFSKVDELFKDYVLERYEAV